MNIENEIRKINHEFSFIDYDLRLNNDDIEELDNEELDDIDYQLN